MNYKIYYKTNGRITGILENSELAECQTQYESDIEYDSTLDLDSEKTKENIFFECQIIDGALSVGIHSERVSESNLKCFSTILAPIPNANDAASIPIV